MPAQYRSSPKLPRFPVEPILQTFADHPYPIQAAATALNVSTASIHRYLQDGIFFFKADRYAVALGKHPIDLWPDWFDAQPDR